MASAYLARSPIAWHKRLEARVLVTLVATAAVTLGAIVATTGRVVTRYSLSRSSTDLVSARAAFDRLVDTRGDSAARETRLIVERPTFRAILTDTAAASDVATITDVTATSCRELSADSCVTTDAHGVWLGRAGSITASPAVAATIASALAPQSVRRVMSLDGRLFLIVAEPAMFGAEVLGTFTAAYRLDDALARDLAFVTHCEVTFVCAGNLVCGTSLPAESSTALKTLLARDRPSLGPVGGPPALRGLADHQYVGAIYTLGASGPSGPELVLLQDWAPTEAAIAQNERALLWIAALALGVAVLAALVLSRRVTRPLRNLAAVADHIANGHWDERVAATGVAEARTMATAFNRMTATLKHWHEQAVARATELQVIHKRFRAVTDSANDAIISVDARGDIVFWNQRAAVVFGYPEEEALGRNVAMLVADGEHAEHENVVARFLSRSREMPNTAIEVTGRRKSGGEVPIEISLSTWTAAAEVHYTAIIRDITDRKEAAEALRQREDELRHAQKMEAVGRLAGGIAHDFNNLLTGMLGYSDLAMTRLPAAHPVRDDLREIQKAGKMAAALTRDLLAFGRKQRLQPTMLAVNDVIRDATNLLRHLLNADITLVLDLDDEVRAIKADRGQITQILLNLAANASDAMPSGGQLTIATRNTPLAPTGDRDGALTLSVSDTGCGMSDEIKAHIFEPFFTTKAIGKGTGLGLASVYGIVTQSGGGIRVESTPNVGTTFFVTFPWVGTPAIEMRDLPELPGAGGGSEVVLVVEDNDPVRALATQALTARGYRVLEARNGEEGLRMALDHLDAIGVVLTDLVMPLMSGRELAARIRAVRPDIKIIFSSGYADDVIAEQALDGAAFIQKPFVPSHLGRTVREVLDFGAALPS